MPPIYRHPWVRRSSSSDSHYAVIFAVLGSVILMSGVLWGYLLPRWRKTHRKPVQTRYNGFKSTKKSQIHSDRDLELPVVFPPHPAVVVPLNKRRGPCANLRVHYSSSIPVYDPRTQSPFPNTPRARSVRPSASDAYLKNNSAVPMSKTIVLHTARLQRNQSQKSLKRNCCDPFRDTWSTSIGQAKHGSTQDDSSNEDRCLLFVARSAGAPPAKPKAARLPSEPSRYRPPAGKSAAIFPDSSLSAVNTADNSGSPTQVQSHEYDNNLYPPVKEEILKRVTEPTSTPGQAASDFHNIFETPSSPGTERTTRFGSSADPVFYDSTPPTAPSSSAHQPRGEVDHCPGISSLVPSRRFKDYIATTKDRHEVISEANSCLSSEDAHDSKHVFVVEHRPVSGSVIDHLLQ